jgi:hypothetical protein
MMALTVGRTPSRSGLCKRSRRLLPECKINIVLQLGTPRALIGFLLHSPIFSMSRFPAANITESSSSPESPSLQSTPVVGSAAVVQHWRPAKAVRASSTPLASSNSFKRLAHAILVKEACHFKQPPGKSSDYPHPLYAAFLVETSFCIDLT